MTTFGSRLSTCYRVLQKERLLTYGVDSPGQSRGISCFDCLISTIVKLQVDVAYFFEHFDIEIFNSIKPSSQEPRST